MVARARTARGTRGIVATGHSLATEAAISVLKDGGNAVDASVAAAFVLAVVTPYACTLGGDLYLLVSDPDDGVTGLNGTGRSPRAATLQRFRDGVPPNGILAATVPGFVRGLADAHARFGRRNFDVLIEPAWRLATDGFLVHPTMAANSAERASLLQRDRAASTLFLPGGKPLPVGARFVQPELAGVLQSIAREGPDVFYAGPLAERMTAAARVAGGLFGVDDFATHTSLWQSPIATGFTGCDVLTMPPNSYGATLLFQLQALEEASVAAVDPAGAAFVELGYEARRQAYRLAAPFIADPDAGDEPLREAVELGAARGVRCSDSRVPREPRDRCTTCAVAIDGDGMAVSLIASISAPFGAGVVLDGTGILLNNRMAGFDDDPTLPNGVGPGKRPANTLAPCLVMKNGSVFMAIGTPGTVGQTCVLAQFLARVLAREEDVAAAVEAPRWSVDFKGNLIVEETFDPVVRGAIGATVKPAGWITFGSIKATWISRDGYAGVADYRRAATTDGW
jgi:gamma-glutamyltranspeptidase / glutathione hydrolase